MPRTTMLIIGTTTRHGAAIAIGTAARHGVAIAIETAMTVMGHQRTMMGQH